MLHYVKRYFTFYVVTNVTLVLYDVPLSRCRTDMWIRCYIVRLSRNIVHCPVVRCPTDMLSRCHVVTWHRPTVMLLYNYVTLSCCYVVPLTCCYVLRCHSALIEMLSHCHVYILSCLHVVTLTCCHFISLQSCCCIVMMCLILTYLCVVTSPC